MDTAPILQYMQTQGLGTKGVDLFRDNMPARATKGLLLTNQTRTRISPEIKTYVSGLFEVTARDATFDAVREKMNSVIDAISSNGGLQLGDMCFLYIRAYNTPLVYPVSESALVEASVLFDFRFIYT